MSDLVDNLLAVERRARRIIADAEKEAAQLKEKAHDDARRKIAAAQKQARADADKVLEDARRGIEEQRADRLQQEREKLPSPDEVDERKLRTAIDFAYNVVAYGDERED